AQTEPSKKDQGKKRKLVKETSDAPSPTKRAKAGKVTKKRMPKSSLQLVDEFVDEGVPKKEPAHDDEEADLQRALELSLKDQGERTQGLACQVVIRETNSGRIQPLPDVQGKGKEKVIDEQAAHDLLTLHTPKQKSPTDQFIFQRRTLMPIKSSRHAESPSLDASNPGDAIESQPQSSHVVHAGPYLEHMDSEATDASSQQNHEQIDEEFTITAYPNDLSFTNQFFVEKPQEEEPEKTNTESEVQSMVMVPIHQDTLSVPSMTSPVIDLTVSHPVSTTIHAPLPTSIATQLSTGGKVGHGSRLYKLENLNIPQQVSKVVNEIVTDAVDWAMQAPLRACFRDLPAMDIKEILQQRMFEDKSYEAHADHKNLYDALQKALERDYSNQLLADLDEARKKKRKRRASPRTPHGSPHSHPPPLAGTSGAPGTSGASGSSQLPPPPAPLSTGTSGLAQQQGSKAPSLSKTAASTYQSMAWTTSDMRYESTGFMDTQETSPLDDLMQYDSILDEQVHLSDDNDFVNDHPPKDNLRKD
ncbi:retrotransposon protein, putative, unclassified, partial [Tanacetum coccineum]